MNILHHKSWHVRTKQNIERVRKDEEKAATEEKDRQRRIAIAEQEARTDILRQRSGKRALEQPAESASVQAESSGESALVQAESSKTHINFFSEEEQSEGRSASGGNVEYEQEKKAEKEKHERSIGLLKYLGEGAVESQSVKPWYYHAPKKEVKNEDISSKDEEFDRKRKSFMDPMRHMDSYVEQRKKIRLSKEETEKKHKHKHKSRDKKEKASGPKSIEQLRAERLAREKAEKKRAQNLLSGKKGEKSEERTNESDERSRRYNSQFNPDIARR